jgi:hemoglobin
MSKPVSQKASPTSASKSVARKSLYHRLGGYDVIAGIVDDFLARHRANPQLARFLAGRSADSRRSARQMLVDQMAELCGGPCFYIGRDMKSSHAGLGINASDWQASMKCLGESLDHFKVPRKEKQEVLAIVEKLKRDIVEPGKP